MKRLIVFIIIILLSSYVSIGPAVYFLIIRHDIRQNTIKEALDHQEAMDQNNKLVGRVTELQYQVDVLTEKDQK